MISRQGLATRLLSIVAYAISYLPFFLLYRLSDGLYFLAYYVFRYRRTVIKRNLANAFPEKTVKQRQQIAKAYYQHLCDVLIENVKLLTISREELLQRFQFENLELLERFAQKEQSLIGVLGHYGNWEMGGLALSLTSPHRVLSVYKPFSNPHLDRLMHRLRSRFGAILVPMQRVSRAMVQYNDELTITMLISDQTPGGPEKAYWTTFLNQATPVFLGPAKMAQKSDAPLLYCHIEKIQRGYYKTTFHLLAENPSDHSVEELTDMHVQALDRFIQKAPAYWLWSHRRWKHDPPASVKKSRGKPK